MIARALGAVLAAGALAGCGSGGGVAALTGGATGDQAAQGRAIFAEHCAACHTLADAQATGTNGPDLDDLKPSATRVKLKATGGGGGMPAFGDKLSGAQIDLVAAYVAEVAGS